MDLVHNKNTWNKYKCNSNLVTTINVKTYLDKRFCWNTSGNSMGGRFACLGFSDPNFLYLAIWCLFSL